MKTNHQRGFKAHKHRKSLFFSAKGLSPLGWINSEHIGHDFNNGNRGMAKSKRGAKKFVRSRHRCHEDIYVRNEVRAMETGDDR